MVLHFVDAFDLEFEVADGAGVEGDVLVYELLDDVWVFYAAYAVLDALCAECIDAGFDEMGGHEFAGVCFEVFTGLACLLPDAWGPIFEW